MGAAACISVRRVWAIAKQLQLDGRTQQRRRANCWHSVFEVTALSQPKLAGLDYTVTIVCWRKIRAFTNGIGDNHWPKIKWN